MTYFEGHFDGQGLRMGIVVSRFNDLITRRLLEGAHDALLRHGVADDAIDVAWVPGAVELSLVAKKMAKSQRYDAVIAIGTVIRGSTSHYDYVCSMVASGLNNACLDTEVPILFAVLTTDTLEQALERAGSKAGNKGFEAGAAAIEMATLLRKLEA